MPLALHRGFGGRAPAETHAAQGAAAAWVTHRRSLRVSCVSCHPRPAHRSEVPVPPSAPHRPHQQPSGWLPWPSRWEHHLAAPRLPGLLPAPVKAARERPSITPVPNGLPDLTRWLGDGLPTTVTGSPGSSQSLRRSREMYGKNLHKQGSKV